MNKVFNINGKNITITDEAVKRYHECTGMDLDEDGIRFYIEMNYGPDPFSDDPGISVDQAIKENTEKALGNIISKSIIDEFNDYE